MLGAQRASWAAAILMLLGWPRSYAAEPAPPSQARVAAALANITTLIRPAQDALATIWDGNKYIQCIRRPDRELRCEAAGALMQPSLARVLVPERVARLVALGWHPDTSFGNYVQTFPASLSADEIARRIVQALAEGYDADLGDLGVRTDWIAAEACPPRNGPSQNLAGAINDARSMARTAIHACIYTSGPEDGPGQSVSTSAELLTLYETTVRGEVQRLRVNTGRRVFFALETGVGYVQCQSQSEPEAIYCEAQSADSWSVLARILTPERVAVLHTAGFADPGRSPNYWKTYRADKLDEHAIADELLTVLHDVYGYDGLPKLKIATEKGRY